LANARSEPEPPTGGRGGRARPDRPTGVTSELPASASSSSSSSSSSCPAFNESDASYCFVKSVARFLRTLRGHGRDSQFPAGRSALHRFISRPPNDNAIDPAECGVLSLPRGTHVSLIIATLENQTAGKYQFAVWCSLVQIGAVALAA
jgi:hypothetical protein